MHAVRNQESTSPAPAEDTGPSDLDLRGGPDGPVTVRGTEDSPLTARQAAARGDLTTGSLHSAALPGGHFHLAPRPPMATFLEPWPTDPHHAKSWRDDALGT